MSAYTQYTVDTRNRIHVVAVPVLPLPLSGIIILLGITIAILGLIIVVR